MRKLISGIAVVVASMAATPVLAGGYAVIVNKDNGNALDKAEVAKIYKGELTSWPDGNSIVVYDLPDNNPTRIAFDQEVADKSVSQMKGLWAVLVFTGKGVPPKKFDTDEDLRKAVASNKNAIGYIHSSSADGSVKVIKLSP